MSKQTQFIITDSPVGGTLNIIGVGTDRMLVEFDEAVANRVKLTGRLFAEKAGVRTVETSSYVRRSDFDFKKSVSPATADKLVATLLNYIESRWDEDWAKDARLEGEVGSLKSYNESDEKKIKDLQSQLDELRSTLESNRAKLAELTD